MKITKTTIKKVWLLRELGALANRSSRRRDSDNKVHANLSFHEIEDGFGHYAWYRLLEWAKLHPDKNEFEISFFEKSVRVRTDEYSSLSMYYRPRLALIGDPISLKIEADYLEPVDTRSLEELEKELSSGKNNNQIDSAKRQINKLNHDIGFAKKDVDRAKEDHEKDQKFLEEYGYEQALKVAKLKRDYSHQKQRIFSIMSFAHPVPDLTIDYPMLGNEEYLDRYQVYLKQLEALRKYNPRKPGTYSADKRKGKLIANVNLVIEQLKSQVTEIFDTIFAQLEVAEDGGYARDRRSHYHKVRLRVKKYNRMWIQTCETRVQELELKLAALEKKLSVYNQKAEQQKTIQNFLELGD